MHHDLIQPNKTAMKTMKLMMALAMMLFTGTFLQAQNNGNVALSKLEVTDAGNGSGLIEIKLSGNNAADVLEVAFTISGECIPGGTYSFLIDQSRYLNPEPTFTAAFPLLDTGKEADQVSVSVEYLAAAGELPARNKIIARRRRSN